MDVGISPFKCAKLGKKIQLVSVTIRFLGFLAITRRGVLPCRFLFPQCFFAVLYHDALVVFAHTLSAYIVSLAVGSLVCVFH